MKVIFFDGVCGLCNGFVDFIIKIDKEKKFYFSPLQSEYAQKNLPPEFTLDLKSVVYKEDDQYYSKSAAVMKVLAELGGIWKLAILGHLLPSSILNWAYDLVAENRYKLFGKKETCRLPTPDERSRFVS
jgi:predicted DCC family thiol-disulfide oxidoreductase YuxK